MAAAEKKGFFAAVEGRAGGTADPVADLVTGNGAKHDWKQKPLKGNNARVGEDAGGDKKRVAGKKKANKEACFYEHDGANEGRAAGAY